MAKSKTGFVEGDARDLKGEAHKDFSDGQKEHVESMSKVVGKESAGKIGHYAESTGGGTPIPRGEKLENHPEAKRVQQPRDEEGKFTYNSVNLKKLKYGPSRGKTIPPFMRGVTMTYAKEKVTGTNVSDGKVYKTNINMTGEEFVKTLREYRETEGGFLGIANAKIESKRGRRSKEERTMVQKGEEGFAANKTTATTTLNGFPTIQSYVMNLRVYKNNFKQKANVVGPMTEKAFNKKNNGPKNNPINNTGNNTENNNNSKNSVDNNNTDNNETVKNNDVTNQTSINDEDVEIAKNNPEQFLDKHEDEIKEIVELANSKKAGIIDVDALIGLVGQGKKDIFEKIKAKLNSL